MAIVKTMFLVKKNEVDEVREWLRKKDLVRGRKWIEQYNKSFQKIRPNDSTFSKTK